MGPKANEWRLPPAANNLYEVICVLHWSEKALKAFREALADYEAAGSPPIPLTAKDYQKTWKRLPPEAQAEILKDTGHFQ